MILDAIAIIPARGGSKRVPAKNLLPLAGRPLLAHSIKAALAADSVTDVYVSTEDERIAEVARDYGAEVVMRPAAIASDTASSESALIDALEQLAVAGRAEPDLVVFLQATSPVRRPGEIDRAIATLQREGADSLFSATPNRELFWRAPESGPEAVNYMPGQRPREQDMVPQFRENGSIYVFKPSVLREHANRLGGKVVIHEMDWWSSFQLDDPEHADLLEWILQRPEYRAAIPWPDQVRLVVFDFDGVMTDNSVIVSESGDELVVASRGDGWGIARLRDAGVPMMVLSTEEHPVVAARCRKLKIDYEHGLADKAEALRRVLGERGIDAAHVVYVGNDANDLECMELVGLSVAVADSHPSALAAATVVLAAPGGRGAVRELCDRLLEHLGRS